MTTTAAAPTTATTAPDWAALRSAVRGRLVTPDEPAWDAARTPWLVNVPQHPAAVLEVADVEDVVAAVRWAVTHGVPVAAQPRGHAPRSVLDGTLLLRTGALDGIVVDTARATARVGAGVQWGTLGAALDGTGLVGLAGSNPDPTVVGLLLGGGVSWFTRKHGFTANSVVSIDLVDATGTLVHVTRTADPDLFWAVRGGGGDFGIVVGVEIALFPAPEMYGGQLMWPVEHLVPVLRAFRDVTRTAPEGLSVWAHVLHFPPLPEFPEPIRGRSFVAMALTHLGTAAEAEQLIAPLRAAAPVEMDLLGPVTPSTLGDVAGEPTDPMPGLEMSALLRDLDDAAIAGLAATVGDPRTCPLAIVQIRHLGGAFADEHPGHGATSPITEPYQLFALGIPAVPEVAAAIPHAFGAVREAVAHVVAGHRMPNFLADGDATASAYRPEVLERLRRIKTERDPDGVIRSNKPVLG